MPAADPARNARFTQLIEPHFQRLFRLACRLTGTKADAEDLIQDLFTRLYADSSALEAATDPGPYLARALYNRFIDSRRTTARRPLTLVGDPGELDIHAAAHDTDPAVMDEKARRIARLKRALARLSEEHRLLVVLHDAEGYTLRELQAITGITTGTLKSRLSRARARLRELLKDLDGYRPASMPGRKKGNHPSAADVMAGNGASTHEL